MTHAAITAAYEDGGLVRGSVIRGTVHTVVPSQHRLLAVATRVGLASAWARSLGLSPVQQKAVWERIEEFARDEWRGVPELTAHLQEVVAEVDPDGEPRSWDQGSRTFAFGHGGLVRRPARGGWDGQGTPLYRQIDAVADRGAESDDPMAELLTLHLRTLGPASRRDLAWWSGCGLRQVDEVLARIADDLDEWSGPGGQCYYDLRADVSRVPEPRTERGLRLLPEFDAVMCGFHPQGRERFVDAEHQRVLAGAKNGLMLPMALVDGRVGGFWRCAGSARKRPLTLTLFAGTRRLGDDELEHAVRAVAQALAITIESVEVDHE